MSVSMNPSSPPPSPALADPTALPSFAQECRTTIKLALPLISGQLGQMLIAVVDTVMIGRLGVIALGAATLTNTVLAVPYVLSIGLLSSISVRVSQARGAERPEDAADALRHGTWLALLFALGVIALSVAGLPWLDRLGQPPEVVASAPTYLVIVAVSFVPAMLSMAWKNHADAMNQPWPAFWILFGGVLLNILLNWLWIWGHWGFPALGLEGAGWATLTARTASAITMFLWITRAAVVRTWTPKRWLTPTSKAAFATLLAIGFPASLQLLTEVSASPAPRCSSARSAPYRSPRIRSRSRARPRLSWCRSASAWRSPYESAK
jgi:MATE family multidrug resistance protein